MDLMRIDDYYLWELLKISFHGEGHHDYYTSYGFRQLLHTARLMAHAHYGMNCNNVRIGELESSPNMLLISMKACESQVYYNRFYLPN
jgi:hypothetical protein